jgi:hypothetical protein
MKGLTYGIQHRSGRDLGTGDPWFGGTVVVTDAPCIPRVGDTISINGIDYEVEVVWHVVTGSAAADGNEHWPGTTGRVTHITVRVR